MPIVHGPALPVAPSEIGTLYDAASGKGMFVAIGFGEAVTLG
jgi:hypothetical protein